jgi:hypothetical protein
VQSPSVSIVPIRRPFDPIAIDLVNAMLVKIVFL